MIKANINIMGEEIFVIDNPECQGRSEEPEKYDLAMVITFSSKEEMRKALADKKIEIEFGI